MIFKLSECQKMVKRLYKNSLKYYPGMSVVVADENKKILNIQGDSGWCNNQLFNDSELVNGGRRYQKGWSRKYVRREVLGL